MVACEIPFVIPALAFDEEESEWIIELYTNIIYSKYSQPEEF